MMMEGEGKSESKWNIRLQQAGMKNKKEKVHNPIYKSRYNCCNRDTVLRLTYLKIFFLKVQMRVIRKIRKRLNSLY